jgi:hypothetical protein
MRPTPTPAQAVATGHRVTLADGAAGAVSKSEADSLPPHLADIADLIGSVDDDLPPDLSARTQHYLRLWGFGSNRPPRQGRQQR